MVIIIGKCTGNCMCPMFISYSRKFRFCSSAVSGEFSSSKLILSLDLEADLTELHDSYRRINVCTLTIRSTSIFSTWS